MSFFDDFSTHDVVCVSSSSSSITTDSQVNAHLIDRYRHCVVDNDALLLLLLVLLLLLDDARLHDEGRSLLACWRGSRGRWRLRVCQRLLGQQDRRRYGGARAQVPEVRVREVAASLSLARSLTDQHHSGALAIIENSRQSQYGYDVRLEVLGSNGSMLQLVNSHQSLVVLHTPAGSRRDVVRSLSRVYTVAVTWAARADSAATTARPCIPRALRASVRE